MLTIRNFIMMAGLLFLLAAAVGLTGCNTMEGVGRDVEGAGRAIQDTF